MDHQTQTGGKAREWDDVMVAEDEEFPYSLVVWNDEVNSFDWVIKSLVEVCGHSEEQAEQCAIIIHHNGKYAVKSGSYRELSPMCEALLDRGISATLEETVPS
jgi:ATP-dependent Clp protease adaptor protein ClpS